MRGARGLPEQRHALVSDELGLYVLSEGHGPGPAAEVMSIAAQRACVRARIETGERAGERECLALLSAVAAELHQLRVSQRAYTGMSAGLAVVLLDSERATVGIVGESVAFVEREGKLAPLLCGQSLLFGPSTMVCPSVVSLPREPGTRLWLALGAAIEVVMATPERGRELSPEALLDASWAQAPSRGAGLVAIEIDKV